MRIESIECVSCKDEPDYIIRLNDGTVLFCMCADGLKTLVKEGRRVLVEDNKW